MKFVFVIAVVCCILSSASSSNIPVCNAFEVSTYLSKSPSFVRVPSPPPACLSKCVSPLDLSSGRPPSCSDPAVTASSLSAWTDCVQSECPDADKETASSLLRDKVACCFTDGHCVPSECARRCSAAYSWLIGDTADCAGMLSWNACMETDYLEAGCTAEDLYMSHASVVLSLCSPIPDCLTACLPVAATMSAPVSNRDELKAISDCTNLAGACSAADQTQADKYLDYWGLWGPGSRPLRDTTCLVEAGCLTSLFDPSALNCKMFNDLSECAEGADACGFAKPFLLKLIRDEWIGQLNNLGNTVLESTCEMPWALAAGSGEDAGVVQTNDWTSITLLSKDLESACGVSTELHDWTSSDQASCSSGCKSAYVTYTTTTAPLLVSIDSISDCDISLVAGGVSGCESMGACSARYQSGGRLDDVTGGRGARYNDASARAGYAMLCSTAAPPPAPTPPPAPSSPTVDVYNEYQSTINAWKHCGVVSCYLPLVGVALGILCCILSCFIRCCNCCDPVLKSGGKLSSSSGKKSTTPRRQSLFLTPDNSELRRYVAHCWAAYLSPRPLTESERKGTYYLSSSDSPFPHSLDLNDVLSSGFNGTAPAGRLVEFFDGKGTEVRGLAIDPQCYCAESLDRTLLVLSFRGTSSSEDVLDCLMTSMTGWPDGGHVHLGINAAFLPLRPFLQRVALEPAAASSKEWHVRELAFCGHSQGGALAVLAFAYFLERVDLEELINLKIAVKLVTCGQLRVGDDKFVERLQKLSQPLRDAGLLAVHRIVNADDLIPRFPFLSIGYKHFGAAYIFEDVEGNNARLKKDEGGEGSSSPREEESIVKKLGLVDSKGLASNNASCQQGGTSRFFEKIKIESIMKAHRTATYYEYMGKVIEAGGKKPALSSPPGKSSAKNLVASTTTSRTASTASRTKSGEPVKPMMDDDDDDGGVIVMKENPMARAKSKSGGGGGGGSEKNLSYSYNGPPASAESDGIPPPPPRPASVRHESHTCAQCKSTVMVTEDPNALGTFYCKACWDQYYKGA